MRPVAFIAFFLSGAASLIFQLIWSRLLHHVFGSSSVAISSVVSVFMGGLALGAWLFGRVADRIKHPLLVYAGVEALVGCAGLCVPLLVSPEGWLATVNGWLRAQVGAESFEFMLARFVCIVPVLIVPTTLMGSTLPLLARHFVQQEQAAGAASSRVGTLYAVNTAGAVAGVLLAGFVLMPQLGVKATNALASSLNFGLAALVLGARRALAPRAPSVGVVAGAVADGLAAEADGPGSSPLPSWARRAAAASFAVAGFASLLYEVVWSRALVNAIGGSVYAFTLILATFLTGIAGGSAYGASVLVARDGAGRALAWAAAVLSVVALTPLAVHGGHRAFGLAGALALGCVVGVQVLVRRRAGRLAVFEGEPAVRSPSSGGMGPVHTALPALLAAGSVLHYDDRLAWLTATVVGSVVLLVLVVAWLRRQPLLALAGIQLQVALATLGSDLWADELSLTFASMVAPLYEVLPDSVNIVIGLMFVTVALCMLPAALGMGAMFPFTLRVFSAGGERIGREVGLVYTGNTVGSIVGAWLPGFVCMPLLGMQPTLHLGIGINLALCLGLCLVWLRVGHAHAHEHEHGRGGLVVAVRGVCVVVVVGMGLLAAGAARGTSPLTWNLAKLTLGAFRLSLARDVIDQEAWGEADLLFYRDGLSTTVSIERWGRHVSLKNNGKVEASNGDDMATQIMVSALPLMLHERGPAGLDAMVVGVGSGVTVGAALQFPLRSLYAVELERAVNEASRFYADVNHLQYTDRYPYLHAPRLQVVNDDGRNFLAATRERFDVIISEPSNPWLTGVSDLFTVDHFRAAKRRLKPGGVYCQWVQLYELSPENVKVIYRTFASQFRHVLVFSADNLSSDTVMLASDSPLPLDRARIARALALPDAAAELARAGVRSPGDVLARVLLSSKDEVLRYTQYVERRHGARWQRDPAAPADQPCPAPDCRRVAAPLNTDDNALIEFRAPRDLIGFERYRGYIETMYADRWVHARLSRAASGFADGAPGAEQRAAQAVSLLNHGRQTEAAAFLAQAEELVGAPGLAPARGGAPGLPLARALLDGLSGASGEPPIELEPPRLGPDIKPATAARLSAVHASTHDWLRRGEHRHALQELQQLAEPLRRYAGPSTELLHAYLLYRAHRCEAAIEGFDALLRREPEFVVVHPELYYFLGRSHDCMMHFEDSVRAMRAYLEASVMGPTLP